MFPFLRGFNVINTSEKNILIFDDYEGSELHVSVYQSYRIERTKLGMCISSINHSFGGYMNLEDEILLVR